MSASVLVRMYECVCRCIYACVYLWMCMGVLCASASVCIDVSMLVCVRIYV